MTDQPSLPPELVEAGYRLVHPDDVDTFVDHEFLDPYRAGWNDCYRKVFGDV